MSRAERLQTVVETFKRDPESVYNTWFIDNETRLKAFRSIRRGVQQVVTDIRGGDFPNDFKGSSLEVVLTAITEQKQVFEGAAHAFYWKPKLRIPDIYENETNKQAFGQFLESALEAQREEQILAAIARLASRPIKGLGPAAANILYFLHPTLIPPSNTAIMRGFNLAFGAKQKLGSWRDYLEMRETILSANASLASLLSKDLGAFAGLLFDIGSGKIVTEENAHLASAREDKKVQRLLAKRHQQVEEDLREASLHTEMQHRLLTVGRALGCDVFVAANDRSRCFEGDKLGFLSLPDLPAMPIDDEVRATVGLIDVLWLARDSGQVLSAFEVEKSTSIYSGILRLTDLALALPTTMPVLLYLVAPDEREREILAQLRRPSLASNERVKISYVLFSDLEAHCASICKLGDDHTIMQKIARCVC